MEVNGNAIEGKGGGKVEHGGSRKERDTVDNENGEGKEKKNLRAASGMHLT